MTPRGRDRLRLLAPIPNPTRGTVALGLELSASSRVSAQIVGVDGRVVRTLASGEWFESGTRTLRWDGLDEAHSPLPSAMYFLVVRASGEMRARRLLLTR